MTSTGKQFGKVLRLPSAGPISGKRRSSLRLAARDAARHASSVSCMAKYCPRNLQKKLQDFTCPAAVPHIASTGCSCSAKPNSKPSVCHCICRKGFQHILSTTNQLLSLMDEAGPSATLDMDNLLLRQSLDVIGLVGFEQDMGATSSLDISSQASNCLAITIPAMAEIECRFRDPFRGRKFWSKVFFVRFVLMLPCIPTTCTKVNA